MEEHTQEPGRIASDLDTQAIKKRCEAAKGIRMCGLSVEGGGDELERLETFIRHARSDLPAALEELEEAQADVERLRDHHALYCACGTLTAAWERANELR